MYNKDAKPTRSKYWSPQRNKNDLTHKELFKKLCQDSVLTILKLKTQSQSITVSSPTLSYL